MALTEERKSELLGLVRAARNLGGTMDTPLVAPAPQPDRPPPLDWHSLVLPVVGILATTVLALAHLLPPEAVFTFVMGVVMPSPGQFSRPNLPTPHTKSWSPDEEPAAR